MRLYWPSTVNFVIASLGRDRLFSLSLRFFVLNLEMLMRPQLAGTFFCLALMLGGQEPAHAEDAEPPIDCEKATATFELNFCAGKELTKADAELNEVYAKVLARIPAISSEPPYDAKSFEAALRASQRAWVAYRDADCNGLVPMSWNGGTATSGEVLGCMTSKTKERTKDLLERYLLE